MLQIIKTLCSHGGFKFRICAHYRELIQRCLKVKRQWKQTELERAGNAPYRETVQMLLQRNSEFALSEPRYGGGLLYVAQLYYFSIHYVHFLLQIQWQSVTTTDFDKYYF
jgi:hypothetical protein